MKNEETSKPTQRKKKVVKRKRRSSEMVKIEALEKGQEDLGKRLDQILGLLQTKAPADVVKTEEEMAQPHDPNAPLKKVPEGGVEFKTGPDGEIRYKFWSPHKELQQKLTDSFKKDINQVTGEYTIVPPDIADFGIRSDGPPGFYITTDPDVAKQIREKIAEKRRQRKLKDDDPTIVEIVEVTNDPLYAHI